MFSVPSFRPLAHPLEAFSLLSALVSASVPVLLWWKDPGLAGWPWYLLCLPSAFLLSVLQHHQHHAPVFRISFLNGLYEFLLSATTGRSPSAMRAHVAGHHALHGTRFDAAVCPQPSSRFDLLGHPARVGRAEARAQREDLRERLRKGQAGRILLDWLPAVGLRVVLIFVDPVKAVVLLLVPFPLVRWTWVQASFLFHAGLDPSHPDRQARGVDGPLPNLLGFSIFRHSAHHRRPELRWFELRPEEADLKRRSPDLFDKSLLAFVLRSLARGFRTPRRP